METPYSRITEIKEASSQEGANDLLKQGFILVKVMERYSDDAEKQVSNIVYVLGRQKPNGESHAAPEQNGHPPALSHQQQPSIPRRSRSSPGRSTPTEEGSGPSTWTGTGRCSPSSRAPGKPSRG